MGYSKFIPLIFLLFLAACSFFPKKTQTEQAKQQLGKLLFFDKRLSLNQTKSCASCHAPELAFTDGYRRSLGIYADATPHNSPSLLNCGENRYFNWANPQLKSLPQQIILPLTLENPIEMGMKGHEAEICARLAQDSTYPTLFAKAFASQKNPIQLPNIVHALAAYVSTLRGYHSKYDAYLQGDTAALSKEAKAGLLLFSSRELGCATCHAGRNFTTNTKGSKQQVYYQVNDSLSVRVPSLRNVFITNPYFHDGSAETLQEVLIRYQNRENKYHQIRKLTARETKQLLHFLESLTSVELI